MRIAIPVVGGKISGHFGRCEEFLLYDTNDETKEISNHDSVVSPRHQPGLLPEWLRELGVNAIIAGGMGQRAFQSFSDNNIEVITGVNTDDPRQAVLDYLAGTIESDGEICDHGRHPE
ncbi:NifB/NifX family molybdenum-iron cluster-binding protein [bacterium]|nr:NifB/NifX family molybdenum-iron cluster-binding protein [bacterium]